MLRKIAERAALAGMSPAMAMKVARVASPLGIASLAGEGLYQVGKLGYEDQQRFNALFPSHDPDASMFFLFCGFLFLLIMNLLYQMQIFPVLLFLQLVLQETVR